MFHKISCFPRAFLTLAIIETTMRFPSDDQECRSQSMPGGSAPVPFWRHHCKCVTSATSTRDRRASITARSIPYLCLATWLALYVAMTSLMYLLVVNQLLLVLLGQSSIPWMVWFIKTTFLFSRMIIILSLYYFCYALWTTVLFFRMILCPYHCTTFAVSWLLVLYFISCNGSRSWDLLLLFCFIINSK